MIESKMKRAETPTHIARTKPHNGQVFTYCGKRMPPDQIDTRVKAGCEMCREVYDIQNNGDKPEGDPNPPGIPSLKDCGVHGFTHDELEVEIGNALINAHEAALAKVPKLLKELNPRDENDMVVVKALAAGLLANEVHQLCPAGTHHEKRFRQLKATATMLV